MLLKKLEEIKRQGIKCIAKVKSILSGVPTMAIHNQSSPLDRTEDKEITSKYLSSMEDYTKLFTYLNDRKEINQEILLKDFFKQRKSRWVWKKNFLSAGTILKTKRRNIHATRHVTNYLLH